MIKISIDAGFVSEVLPWLLGILREREKGMPYSEYCKKLRKKYPDLKKYRCGPLIRDIKKSGKIKVILDKYGMPNYIILNPRF